MVKGGAGNDEVGGGTGDDKVHGGAGDDKVWGGEGDDVVKGGAGNDEVGGGTGDDKVHGGAGDDKVWRRGEGDDVVKGGAGNDEVGGGTGNDKVHGGAGDDKVWGGEGDDVVTGGQGDDKVWGGAGDDVLKGGTGDDVLHGDGKSSEIIEHEGQITADNFNLTDQGFQVTGKNIDGIISAANVDTSGGSLGVVGAAVGSVVPNQIGHNPETGESEAIIVDFDHPVSSLSFDISRAFKGEGNNRGDASGDEQGSYKLYRDDVLVGEGIFTASTGHKASIEVETKDSGEFNKIVFEATEYSGGDGMISSMVELVTTDSSDYLIDSINFTSRRDDLIPLPGGGDDILDGGQGDDKVWGGAGDDVVKGGARWWNCNEVGGGTGNDKVHGGTGDDKVWGGEGDDVVTGGQGDDKVWGGAGDDVVKVDWGAGNDEVGGGTGDDKVHGGAGNGRQSLGRRRRRCGQGRPRR